MEKDELLLRKRLLELAELCARRDIPTHTDFLTPAQQEELQNMSGVLPPVRVELTGGFLASERKTACFLPSYLEKLTADELPFACVRIAPVNARFAEELSHRDFLGALMNLGIARPMIGDIVRKDGAAYVFIMKKLAGYVCESLTTVRHTAVQAEPVRAQEAKPEPGAADRPDIPEAAEPAAAESKNGAETAEAGAAPGMAGAADGGFGFDFLEPEYEEILGSVNSLRLDGLTALAGRLSRARAAELIAGERAAVNGRAETSPSRLLREGDILSLRGIGKFRFAGCKSRTKKGRMLVTLLKYK